MSPVIDLTAIVQMNPLFSTATHVGFVCRDAGLNWWFLVNGYLLKTDSVFNSLGVIPAPGGIPTYEPVTNRIYFVHEIANSVPTGCLFSWHTWPNCSGLYQYSSTEVWGCRYLDLSGSTAFVAQYAAPQAGIVHHAPSQVAPDGQGNLLIKTGGGDYAFDAASGSPSAAPFPVPADRFMQLPGSTASLVAKNGSCSSGPASTCVMRRDLATGTEDLGFPVDLSIPGPGAELGGECVGISAFVEQGQDVALMLMNSQSRSYAYLVDVTAAAEWSGCGGGFVAGPVVEYDLLEASLQIPGTVAWLIASPGYLQLGLPLLPSGCSTHLDPVGHIALSPQLVPPGGQVSWSDW